MNYDDGFEECLVHFLVFLGVVICALCCVGAVYIVEHEQTVRVLAKGWQ